MWTSNPDLIATEVSWWHAPAPHISGSQCDHSRQPVLHETTLAHHGHKVVDMRFSAKHWLMMPLSKAKSPPKCHAAILRNICLLIQVTGAVSWWFWFCFDRNTSKMSWYGCIHNISCEQQPKRLDHNSKFGSTCSYIANIGALAVFKPLKGRQF